MRICQVMAGGGGEGGLKKHVVELCQGLSSEHEVIAVAHPDNRAAFDSRVRFESVDLTRSRFHPGLRRGLRRLLAELAPDIVHAHATKAAVLVRRAAAGTGAKLVGTVHGLKKSLDVYRHFDEVIAVSQGAGAAVPNDRVTVVYNGVDPPQLPEGWSRAAAAKGLGIDCSRPVVLAVGRLVPVKGFDVLLEAWRGVPATLLVAGDGPEAGRLRAQVEARTLVGQVKLLGHREDVPSLMALSDLVVIPSRREGFSYVMAEALRMRRPVVATAVPGPREVLPARFLVAPENAGQLGQVLTSVLADLGGARRDTEEAWAFAEREFCRERMVERTEQVYARALSRGH